MWNTILIALTIGGMTAIGIAGIAIGLGPQSSKHKRILLAKCLSALLLGAVALICLLYLDL